VHFNKFKNSVILFDKPVGQTSFDVISKVKRLINVKKIGHSGTLDKFASGLLVICTGQATRLTNYFLESDKRYFGTVRLGISTETDDINGEIIETRSVENIGPADLIRAIDGFRGQILQKPPVYSALKINGKRASDLARKGLEVNIKERQIHIYNIDLVNPDLENDRFMLDISCSKGTYIRSIARDLGIVFGTGAHLEALRRTESGRFRVDDAVTFPELESCIENGWTDKKFLLSPAEALDDYESITVNEKAKARVLNGALFDRGDIVECKKSGKNFHIILDEEKNLIAIADVDIEKWQIKYLNVFNR